MFLLYQTDSEPCVICNHIYVQKLHTKAEFEADKQRILREYHERLATFTAKSKDARGSSQPPRMGQAKVIQEHICPCAWFVGRKCPECKGNAPRVPDPNGREGATMSSCPVCQCECSVGPFKNSDRPHLHAAFQDWRIGKVAVTSSPRYQRIMQLVLLTSIKQRILTFRYVRIILFALFGSTLTLLAILIVFDVQNSTRDLRLAKYQDG